MIALIAISAVIAFSLFVTGCLILACLLVDALRAPLAFIRDPEPNGSAQDRYAAHRDAELERWFALPSAPNPRRLV